MQQLTTFPRPLSIRRRPLAVSACRLQLTGRCICLPELREEECGAIMGCSRPLVSGGCVLKGGDEMRHAWSVRPSYAVGNAASRAAIATPEAWNLDVGRLRTRRLPTKRPRQSSGDEAKADVPREQRGRGLSAVPANPRRVSPDSAQPLSAE